MTYYDKILIDNKEFLTSIFLRKGCNSDLSNDLYQELYLKVYNQLQRGKYDSKKGKFLGWVVRIASNLFIDHVRKQNRSKEIKMKYWYGDKNKEINILDYKPDTTLNQEQKIVYQDLCNEVWYQFLKLSDAQKQIIDMRVFLKLSYKEIIDIVGGSQGVWAARLGYARNNLRKRVKF